MPSSTAWISCSRETCFSALSWRRAPTKSRLTLPPRCANFRWADIKKRGGHPRTERPFSYEELYTRTRGGLKLPGRRGSRCGLGHRQAGGLPKLPEHSRIDPVEIRWPVLVIHDHDRGRRRRAQAPE